MFRSISLAKALSVICLFALAMGALAPLLDDADAGAPRFRKARFFNGTKDKPAVNLEVETKKDPEPPVVPVDKGYDPAMAPGGMDEFEVPMFSMPASSITCTVDWADQTDSVVALSGLDAPTGFEYVQVTALPGGLLHLFVEYIDSQQTPQHASVLGQ